MHPLGHYRHLCSSGIEDRQARKFLSRRFFKKMTVKVQHLTFLHSHNVQLVPSSIDHVTTYRIICIVIKAIKWEHFGWEAAFGEVFYENLPLNSTQSKARWSKPR
jgi:hypothetical protein